MGTVTGTDKDQPTRPVGSVVYGRVPLRLLPPHLLFGAELGLALRQLMFPSEVPSSLCKDRTPQPSTERRKAGQRGCCSVLSMLLGDKVTLYTMPFFVGTDPVRLLRMLGVGNASTNTDLANR